MPSQRLPPLAERLPALAQRLASLAQRLTSTVPEAVPAHRVAAEPQRVLPARRALLRRLGRLLRAAHLHRLDRRRHAPHDARADAQLRARRAARRSPIPRGAAARAAAGGARRLGVRPPGRRGALQRAGTSDRTHCPTATCHAHSHPQTDTRHPFDPRRCCRSRRSCSAPTARRAAVWTWSAPGTWRATSWPTSRRRRSSQMTTTAAGAKGATRGWKAALRASTSTSTSTSIKGRLARLTCHRRRCRRRRLPKRGSAPPRSSQQLRSRPRKASQAAASGCSR